MRTIWKQVVINFPVNDVVEIKTGRSFAFVMTGKDPASGQPAVWFEIDTDEDLEVTHRLTIVGTGHPIEEALGSYVGSVIDDPFVWHLYRTTKFI